MQPSANDNPIPQVTYRQRISDMANTITKHAAEVVGAEYLDQVHTPPQQFQVLTISAFAPDTAGKDIQFNMTSNAACLPEFSAFIMATAAARGIAHIAMQTAGNDEKKFAVIHEELRNAFMEHLMQAMGFGAIVAQAVPEGQA